MTKFLLLLSIFLINLCNLIAIDFKQDIEGKNCSVIEPIRNFTFNFNEINSDFGYHINGNDENMGQYSFNLCKPLSRKCNNQTAAGCLKVHQSSKEIIIGYSSKLYWNNGQIRLSYVGEKCKDSLNYTLNVLLHCDYKQTKNDFLGVFHNDEQCEVNIVMKTPNACLPMPDNIKNAKLFVKTPSNETLNFNALKSSNHIAEASSSNNSFIIGFPILYGHNVMCEAGSSVCSIDDKETDIKKKYKNMGTMTSDIKFENGQPMLLMTSNELCKEKKTYSSKIIFKCDKLIAEGSPKFIKEIDCVNHFEWETMHACSDERTCQVMGSNGESYDLSSLAGIQYQVARSNKTNEVIHFSLCAPAKECGVENWGSCIVKIHEDGTRQTTSVGFFNTKMHLDKKNAFLKYQDGSKCNGNGDKFSTKIEFIVADNPEDEEVVLIEDKCEIVVHFKTLMVNQNVKNCIVKNRNDVEIDLRPLIDYNGNYEAIKPSNEPSNVHYYLNVCRPLNSKYSLNCHGNTAACKTIFKDNKHEEELSLGHFDYVMSTEPGKTEGTSNVIMKYFGGSKCPEDEDEHIITSINFYCDDLAGLGNPVLKSTENCEYKFDFPTNILCNDEHLKLKEGDSCELLNEKTNKSVTLKGFGIFESDNVKVNICDNTNKFYTINYKDSMILIEYAQNAKDIQVQLKCGLGNNTKIDVSDDQVLIMNESTIVCPLMNIVPRLTEFVANTKPNSDDSSNETKPSNNEQKADDTSSGGFSMGYVFLIVILVMAFAVLYVVLRNPERREIIRNMAKFRSRSNVRYARVRMNEESALLTDNNELIPSDSDDENILL